MARNLFYVGFLFKNDYFMQLSKEMTSRILGRINYASAYSEWLINNLIFKNDFEYIVLKDVSKEELTIINQKNTFNIVLNNSLNVPVLNDYKNQDKKFQICNINSCRLATNEINNI